MMGKRVTVVGCGVSGVAACEFLVKAGATVKLTDNSDTPDIQAGLRKLQDLGIECEIGRHTEGFLAGTELLLVSPGVDNNSLAIRWAEAAKIPIISEIELAYRFCKGKIIAISGTNGKSTVTSLIGEIFKRSGRRVHVCGNIGVPFISVVPEIEEGDIAVLEISSFQLERIDRFKPHISILLNIAEDHLDRYEEFDDYIKAKFRIFANQDESDYAILNFDQVRLRNKAKRLRPKPYFFSKQRLSKEHNGAYVENEELVVRQGKRYIWIANKESLSLAGDHNLENSLAAGLTGLIMGVEPDIINDTLSNFKSLKHRFELVDTIKSVRFIDDSKATNIDSAARAIQSLPKGIVLIAGGRDKGGDYKVITKLVKEKVKSMVLIGESKDRIAGAFSKVVPVDFAPDLKGAVETAFQKAKARDTVLLSPMCSSFDMFKDYTERGEVFRQAVAGLKS